MLAPSVVSRNGASYVFQVAPSRLYSVYHTPEPQPNGPSTALSDIVTSDWCQPLAPSVPHATRFVVGGVSSQTGIERNRSLPGPASEQLNSGSHWTCPPRLRLPLIELRSMEAMEMVGCHTP